MYLLSLFSKEISIFIRNIYVRYLSRIPPYLFFVHKKLIFLIFGGVLMHPMIFRNISYDLIYLYMTNKSFDFSFSKEVASYSKCQILIFYYIQDLPVNYSIVKEVEVSFWIKFPNHIDPLTFLLVFFSHK